MISLATLILAILSAAISRQRCADSSACGGAAPRPWHRTVTPVTGGIALFGAFAIVLLPSFASGVVGPLFPLVLGAGASVRARTVG